MGGGSDTPDVPDYSEIEGMLKDVFNVTGARAKELWDWGKKAYETNSGIGRQAIKGALDQMTKLSKDADYYRGRSKEYEGAERKQLADAMKMGTPAYQEEKAGQAAEDVARNVKAAREAAMQRLEGLGIAQSALAGGDLATRVSEAGMQASAANAGREAARKEGQDALAAAIGTGANLRSNVNPAAAGSLNAGGQAASIGPAIDAGRIASAGAAGQQTALGASAAGNLANVKNMGFTNAMDKFNADAAQPGWEDLVGTAVGIGTKFIKPFEEGGAIPEPTQMFANGGGPVPPEMSPSGGAIPDDIGATINGTDGTQQQAQINAHEFIVPAPAATWIGEKQLQKLVAKALQERGDPNAAPAQPEMAQGAPGEMPPPTMDGAGIPPIPTGVA